MINDKLKFIDLFCGIGGFRIALEKLGFECVFSCDIDEHAREIYYANFGEYPQKDIKNVDINKIPNFDVLCAGFPCQPFSVAGKRNGFNDTRGTLFFEIEKILKIKKPKYFILENVVGLLTHDKGKTFNIIIENLINLGYFVSHKVFNVKDFGIPQNRERVIIVGSLERKINLEKIKYKPNNNIEKFFVFNDETSLVNHKILDKKEYTIIDKSLTKKQKSGLLFVGYLNKNIRTKGTLPNTLHLSRVHRQCNRIYSSKGVSPTITSGETSGRYFIYLEELDKVIKLNIEDCFTLMGFPKSFIKIGSQSNLYKRIGNSVCIDMIYESAKLFNKKEFLT